MADEEPKPRTIGPDRGEGSQGDGIYSDIFSKIKKAVVKERPWIKNINEKKEKEKP